MTTQQKPDPKPRGRPALAPGEGRTARVEWRTTPDVKASAQQQADKAGLSLSAWLDSLVLRPAADKNSNSPPSAVLGKWK